LLNYQAIKKEKTIIPNGRWAAANENDFKTKELLTLLN
jgi:hypothetical protein